MSPTDDPHTLHQYADQSLELGDHLTALQYCDQAMIAYQQRSDIAGFARIRTSRFKILRSLYEHTHNNDYLILAKNAILSAVEIAIAHELEANLAPAYFYLAKAQELLEQYDDAVISYQQAYDNILASPPPELSRPGVVADYKLHLGTCRYRVGDKLGLDQAVQALQELTQAQEPQPYVKDRWLAIGNIRIATVLRDDHINQAEQYLRNAKHMLDAMPHLADLWPRWNDLAKTFKFEKH